MSPLSVETVATEPAEDADLPSIHPPPPALTYDADAGRPQVTRRQFRFLLMLTLVNTLMLGLFVAGPGLSKMTGGWWNSYKQWRAERANAKQVKALRDKFLANYRQLLGQRAPADKVAYEEDQERAAKLVAGGEHAAQYMGSGVYLTPKPWQVPAIAQTPVALQVTARAGPPGAPLFIGSRRTPSGQERLVWVALLADQRWETLTQSYGQLQTTRFYKVRARRILKARAFRPHPTDTTLEDGSAMTLEVFEGEDFETSVKWHKTTSWENGRIEIEARDVMRFFMGQPDPNDPSRFTIRYELDGQGGIIDGQLHDDQSVTLQPRQGRIIRSDQLERNKIWDPRAEPAPK